MGKKSKGEQGKTSAAHNENLTIRYRLKQSLVRVDRTGIPIPSDPRALAKAMIEAGAMAPPMSRIQPPPAKVPDNVLPFKAKDKPVNQAGNEAEVVYTTAPAENSMKAKLASYAIHDVIKAEAETFKRWKHRAATSKSLSFVQGEQWFEAEMERQRFKSAYGHFKKDKPGEHGGYADTGQRAGSVAWHNQRLSEKMGVSDEQIKASAPLDRKFWDMSAKHVPLTPSGLPISEFTTGKYKPKDAVVYTTANELPPTPTRDWRAGQSGYNEYATHMRTDPGGNAYWQKSAANDNSVQVRKTPATSSWVYKTQAMVQWFINNVEPQNWPTHVHNFATWKEDGPVPNTGAINKAASHPETELILVRSLYEGLEKDHKMIDSALAMATQEVNLLNQEVDALKEERRILEYALAQQSGDYKSAEIIAGEVSSTVIKSKPPQVPDDADVMIAQFNTFKSFVLCDGLEHAFARYVYGDPRLGEVIRDHADMRCNERQVDVQYRNLVRFMTKLGEHIKQKHDEQYIQFWKDAYPKWVRNRARRKISAVRDPAREAVAYAAMSRKAKPALHKTSSTYYSSLERPRIVTNAVGKAIIQKVRPSRPQFNNPSLVEGDNRESWHSCEHHRRKYQQWWEERADYCELKWHESTTSGRIKIRVVKTYNKVVDTLNLELNPAERKRKAKLIEDLRAKQRNRDEIREQRREQRKQAKLDKRQKQRAKELYRLVH